MANDTPYDLPVLELIDKFMSVVGRAGLSNSGMVIDPMANEDRADARYVRSALWARLEGVTPPCVPRTKLRALKRSYSRDVDCTIEVGTDVVVDRVLYGGNNTWRVEPKGYDHYAFLFTDFEPVGDAAAQPA